MIVQAIFTFAAQLLAVIVSLFPQADSSTVTSITNSTDSFRSYISAANWIFPVDTFFTVLGIFILIESAWFGWKFIRWILSIISVGILK